MLYLLASSQGKSNSLCQWDLSAAKRIRSVALPDYIMSSALALSPDGSTLVTRWSWRDAAIWEAGTLTNRSKIPFPAGNLVGLLRTDNRSPWRMALGSSWWTSRTGECVRR